jgi:hypothetical protein
MRSERVDGSMLCGMVAGYAGTVCGGVTDAGSDDAAVALERGGGGGGG